MAARVCAQISLLRFILRIFVSARPQIQRSSTFPGWSDGGCRLRRVRAARRGGWCRNGSQRCDSTDAGRSRCGRERRRRAGRRRNSCCVHECIIALFFFHRLRGLLQITHRLLDGRLEVDELSHPLTIDGAGRRVVLREVDGIRSGRRRRRRGCGCRVATAAWTDGGAKNQSILVISWRAGHSRQWRLSAVNVNDVQQRRRRDGRGGGSGGRADVCRLIAELSYLAARLRQTLVMCPRTAFTRPRLLGFALLAAETTGIRTRQHFRTRDNSAHDPVGQRRSQCALIAPVPTGGNLRSVHPL